jgi:hypothetical protein
MRDVAVDFSPTMQERTPELASLARRRKVLPSRVLMVVLQWSTICSESITATTFSTWCLISVIRTDDALP